MSDPTAEYAAAHELGNLERRVPIRSTFGIPDGSRAEAELCLTPSGVWLVAAKDAELGRADNVLSSKDVKYVKGKKTDKLHFDGVSVEVSSSKRSEVLEALALGRVRGNGPRSFRPLLVAKHVEPPSAVERAALEAWLSADELLLAHVRTTASELVASPVLGEANAPLNLVLTERRVALMGLTEVGDITVVELARGPMEWDVSSKTMSLGGRRFSFARNPAWAGELSSMVPLDPPGRLLLAARLNWGDRSSKAERLATARRLLDVLSRRGDPLGHVAQFFVSEELEEPLPARPSLDGVVSLLAECGTPPNALSELWRSFEVSLAAGRNALDVLRAQGSSDAVFDLHAAIRARAIESAGEEEAAAVDAEFAEHALSLGKSDRARKVLEHRLQILPTRPLDEVAPATTRSAASVTVRARLLELLAEARGTPDLPDVESLRDLARLQPLSVTRLESLARSASGSLRERAKGALSALTGHGLSLSDSSLPEPKEPLSDALLAVLRVSAGADVAALFGVLQTFVASSALPDRSLIRDYCEELARDGIAERAITRAGRALGLGDVGGYVSRGRKDIGVRAYETRPPFLLVGGRHLDEGEFRLSEAELCFAVGAELAHVRFEHARVTSEQVWEGALSKGKQGLDTVLGVLPMLKGLTLAGRFSKVAAQLESERIRKAMQGAQAFNEALRQALSLTSRPEQSDGEDAITASNEKLIVAHRFMQLSADRVGLVLAADIASAVRAILLTRRDYARILPDVRKSGLAEVLRERVEAQDPAFSDLAVRLAALIAFYLSEDYVRVTRALEGDGESPAA